MSISCCWLISKMMTTNEINRIVNDASVYSRYCIIRSIVPNNTVNIIEYTASINMLFINLWCDQVMDTPDDNKISIQWIWTH